MPNDTIFWSCSNCETSNPDTQESCMVCGTDKQFAITEEEAALVVTAPRQLPTPISETLEWNVPGKVYQMPEARLTQKKRIKKRAKLTQGIALAANWGAVIGFTLLLAGPIGWGAIVGVGLIFSVIGGINTSYIVSGLASHAERKMKRIKDPSPIFSQLQRYQGGHDAPVRGIKFFTGREVLLSGDAHGFMYSWDTPTGNLQSEGHPYKAGIDKIAIGRYYTFVLKGKLLTQYKHNGKQNWNTLLSHPSAPETPMQFSNGAESWLGIGYANGKVQLMRVTSRRSSFFQMPSPTPVTAISIHEKSNHLLAGNGAGQVQLYNFNKKKLIFTKTLPGGPITAVAVNHAGLSYLAGCKDGSIVLWLTQLKYKELSFRLPLLPGENRIQPYPVKIDFLPKNHWLIIADSEGYITIWSLLEGRVTDMGHKLYTGVPEITSLDFSEFGNWIAVGGKKGEIGMFNIEALKIESTKQG